MFYAEISVKYLLRTRTLMHVTDSKRLVETRRNDAV